MLENLELVKLRHQRSFNGRQHERMIADKKRAFDKALLYSYQAGLVRADRMGAQWVPALINPDKVKFDYDEKIISIDFVHQFKSGTTFEWPKESGVHWIILKQELTELAYFRGNIRRCQMIETQDPKTKELVLIWAAIRGPVEIEVKHNIKSKISVDVPNLSLNAYVTDNDINRRTFDRYQKFYFHDRWWEVTAPDSISTPGIINFEAVETYDQNNAALLYPAYDPNPIIEQDKPQIIGEVFIKPYVKNTYIAKGVNEILPWRIEWRERKGKEANDVIEYKIDKNKIEITWVASISSEFILKYGDLEKTIVVESLF